MNYSDEDAFRFLTHIQNTFRFSGYRQFRNKEDTRLVYKSKINSPETKKYCPEVTISFEPPFIHIKAKGCEFEKVYDKSPDIIDLNNMFIAFNATLSVKAA